MERSLIFRKAEPQDAPAIWRLVESAYRGESSRRGWTTEADFLAGQRCDVDSVLEMIAGSGQILLCVQAAELLACVYIEPAVSVGGGDAAYAKLGLFAVNPQLQAQGVGSALFAEAERRALELFHPKRLLLQVISLRSALIAFYERRGYVVTDEREPFPYGDPRFGTPLRDDLEFVVLHKPVA